MNFKSVIILATFSLAAPALANSNTPVTESYESFKNAMQAESYDGAAASAFNAWQEAEVFLGDHPITNVLAQNYANLHYNVDLDHDRVIEAYLRSIELSILPEDKRSQAKVLARYVLKTGDIKIKRQLIAEFKTRFDKDVAFISGWPDPFSAFPTPNENPATASSRGFTTIRP